MAEWASKERIYFGDHVGNAVEAWAGIVTVGKRTTLGIQFRPNPNDWPDLTLDDASITTFRGVLARFQAELLQQGGR
ncbi:hypothetical protein DMH04_41185 [Kibdelosporangium aridum]|uniref:Uncharacterized protein n=1 Tax=Kibdelosporangium aridum TaxID=2030 RepID=A0A428YUP4_KIBAR|nr:hypothetical protein [Kibdelosporangium aridum]RSM73428.1 hypothetical protein DMH04_41185 [Kibdelosporangium aridum]